MLKNKSKFTIILFWMTIFCVLMPIYVWADSSSIMDEMFLNQVKYEDGEFIYSTQAFVGGYARYEKELLDTQQGFEVSFDYKCINKGADGIMLNFETSKSVFGTAIKDSYGVEFNRYYSSTWSPHSITDPHVAITKDSISNHYKYSVNSLIWNSDWNTITVEYRGTSLSVYVNSIMVLSADNIVLPDKVYFTITALDGLSQSKRYVKNVKLDYERPKQNLLYADINLSDEIYSYDGKEKKPSVTVKYDGEKLTSADYTVKYLNNKYAGTATVEITGQGNYVGTVKKTFTIKAGKKITVTFDGNGGTVSKKTINVNSGNKYGTMPTVKRKGYKLLGWFTAKSGGKQIKKTSYVETTKNQKLYARWKKENYTITYKLNGGRNSKNNPKTYTISTKSFSLKNPTRSGYTFRGWYSDSGFKKKVTSINKGSTGNKTLYAKWEPYTMTITFKGNGSISPAMSSKKIKYGLSYKLSANTYKAPNGYEFAGWSFKQNGDVIFADKGDISMKDLVDCYNYNLKNNAKLELWAKWRLKRYKITYDLNGGTNPASATTTFDVTKEVKLPTPQRTGYIFKGWYLNGKKITTIKKNTTGNKTFVAKWKPITYTIKFEGNNILSSVPKVLSCKYDVKYVLPGDSNQKWNTRADGMGTIYIGGSVIENITSTQGSTIILYAMKPYEEAWFPMETMNITQIAYESYSHDQYNAMDICGSLYMFAPFSGRIVSFNRNYGKVIFVSEDKVKYADGRYDYMSILLLHASNLDELEKLYKEKTLITQGTPFYHQGKTGAGGVPNPAYGTHVELRVAQGIQEKDFPGNVYAFDAFYVNRKKTTKFVNKGLMKSGNHMTNSNAPTNWSNLWRYID